MLRQTAWMPKLNADVRFIIKIKRQQTVVPAEEKTGRRK